ncbi:MAG: PAS domain S-box protein, partial [Campylobacterales bacterium]|nr:PAS domain S-box protein [Campylobacterales bacterium]
MHAMVQHLPGFAYSYKRHADGKEEFLYASENVLDTYGIDAKTIQSDLAKLRASFHPDDFVVFKKAIEHSAQTLERFYMEFRYFHPSKGLVWLETRSQPTRQNDGSIIWHGITLDISKRKHIEEKWIQKEKEFRTLAENSPDTIARFDKECRRTYVNPAFERVLGLSSKEVLGKKPSETTPVANAFAFEKQLQEVLQSGKEFTTETPYIDASGNHGTGHVHMLPEFDKDKQIVSVICIGRDISERKKMEEKLIQTSTHLLSLLNTIPDLVWMKDINGKYLTCNHAFESFFGAKANAIMGKTDYDFVEKEQADFFRQKDVEAIQKGTVDTNEEHITPKETRRQRLFETRKAPVYDSDGKLLGVLGIAKDITEQQKAKLELHNQSNLLSSILNSSLDVAIFALDGEYKYLAFNQNHEETMKALWGQNISVGMNILEVITHQDDKLKAKKLFDKALAGEHFVDETSYGEDNFVRTYWQTFYAPMYDDSGKIRGLTCFNLDISEQKKLQDNLLFKEFILDKINEAVYFIDEDSMFHYVNERACHDLGYSKEELLSMGVVHIDPNVSMARWREIWKGVKEFRVMTSENKRKDGTLFPVEVVSSHSEYNGMSYSLAIARDITERKAQEEAIAQREREFRTLAENSPDTIVRFDHECRRTYVNPSTMRITGLLEEELLGVKPSDFSPLKESLLFEKTLQNVIQTGEEATLEMEFVSPLGYKGWRHLHVVPEVGLNGEINSVLAIGRDISEHKKIELQLRDNETILQEAQRIAKIGSWKLDIVTQAITWSEEMYRIFEVDPKNTKSRRKLFMEMIHPEDMSHIKELYYRAQKKHTPYETTHRILLKDGTLKYIHTKAITYYDKNHNPASIMGTVQDVTKQKMVEKQVEFLAHHDALTELPNRMLAKSRCEQSIAYAKRNGSKVALLFIDLDGF